MRKNKENESTTFVSPFAKLIPRLSPEWRQRRQSLRMRLAISKQIEMKLLQTSYIKGIKLSLFTI